MPAQVTKSILAVKLGSKFKEAVVAARGQQFEVGNAGLPPGINSGVAQLVSCQFGEYKTGELVGKPFFMAAGIVKLPVEHNGVGIFGRRTQIGPEPICDTPRKTRKTVAEHIAWIRNELGILGFNMDDAYKEGASEAEIEAGIRAGMQALVKQGVHFSFRTWQGSKQVIVKEGGKIYVQNENGRGPRKGPYANEEIAKKQNPFLGQEPMVQQEWNGACEYSPNGDATTAGTDDSTGEAGTTSDDNTGGVDASEDGAAASEGGTGEQFSEFGDLDSLVTIASDRKNSGRAEAQKQLKEMATSAGVSDMDIEAAEDWQAVADLITAAQSDQGGKGESESTEEGEGEAEGKEEEPEPLVPEKGSVYRYTLLDADGKRMLDKNKKPRKPIEVEVTAVDKKSSTATVKALDDKTIYKGVAWDQLEIVN